MRLKHTSLRLAGAAMIAAAVVPWLGGGTASASVTVYLDAKWDGENSATSNVSQAGCGYDEITMPHSGQGWHFVLPGGSGLSTFTANFETAGQVTVTTTDGPSGVIVQDGKGAVVYTPDDDVLQSIAAFADHPGQGTADTAGTNDMQLSHLCNGEGPPPTSPPPTTTSAPVTTSAPPTTTSAPPTTSSAPVTSATSVAATTASQAVSVLPTKVENTTAEASPETSVLGEAESLPHTGGGVPYLALAVISLGLLLAGGALMFLPGLSVERANRRH